MTPSDAIEFHPPQIGSRAAAHENRRRPYQPQEEEKKRGASSSSSGREDIAQMVSSLKKGGTRERGNKPAKAKNIDSSQLSGLNKSALKDK